MSDVNTKSVRDEASRLKTKFNQLFSEKKIPTECKRLMKNMIELNELILSIFLERTTKKNSNNSSIPPSQTNKDESSLTHKGTNTKGKTEANITASNARIKETVTIATIDLCDVCGEELSNTSCQHHERRTKIDIIFEKTIDHVDAEIKICPTCDSTVKGDFHPSMAGPLQYGNGIKSYIINSLVCQMIPLNRLKKFVNAMIGTVIAEATLLKFILRLHLSLALWEAAATKKILAAPAMNVDETSLRVDKNKQWIHVYSAGDITLKFLHSKRGKEAVESINIIPKYGGTIIHDCWASYLSYNHCKHGLCGSHLVRELTHIVESNNYVWAKQMKVLLLETCKTVSNRKKKRLTKNEYSDLQRNYRNVLSRGEKELPVIPPKPKGKRGKMAKSDAHNLWERLKEYEIAVLLFAKKSNVSFTNNRAERDLRMAKVKQKISGCFRTELYAQAYCRISSYLQTMANKGYNPLIAIQMALAGEIDQTG